MNSKEYIYDYIKKSGILLLGSNSQFDNLMDIGGDWDTIMELIQERKVYFSKIFKGMTTYISDEMYPYFKIMKDHKITGENEEKIYDFLEQHGGQDTELIKTVLGINKKTFDNAMNNLLKGMQVTVLERGVTLNKQWSTYIWGTCEQWEKEANLKHKIISTEEAYRKIYEKLIGRLSEKKINNLLK
ncbi:MAG TPA: hypothetical protein DDY59_13210 [Lachnospiraceae bacterium]|jgi:hypothetical protein|nr:hypothetical protein [Lachnospiraceae bacterium]HCM13238.1 hypothetical protein [Lachnospiraceae bacterium]